MFFCISAVCRVLRGASPHEIQVQASCIHLESSVWKAENRMGMHFECELDFEMMIEFLLHPHVCSIVGKKLLAASADSASMNRLMERA